MPKHQMRSNHQTGQAGPSQRSNGTRTLARRSRTVRWLAFGAAGLLLLGACTDGADPSSSADSSSVASASTTAVPGDTTSDTSAHTSPGTSPANAATQSDAATPRLFDVQLTQGQVPQVADAITARADGTTVSADRLAALTSRLPAWDEPSSLTAPFAWPKQAPPPPRTGKTVDQAFPPNVAADAPSADNGPLKVLRVQPEGDVPIAPYLAITFNQPMVAVGTVAQVSASTVPVRLTPDVPGTWQWIGTRTLRFDADSKTVDRLPMATTFTATVPAGTRSVAGGVLAADSSFTFTTPPPKVLNFGPRDSSLPLVPVFVATFDQRVEPQRVLSAISLRADGEKIPVRLATTAEVAADATAVGYSSAAENGRWLAFRPMNPLPKDAVLEITVGPGTPSAEGPLTSQQPETFSARTYGPLKVVNKSCSYGDGCPPGSSFYIEFSNALDARAEANISARITVSPTLAVMKATVNGGVSIEGATQPRTTYTVNLPPTLTDMYGQTLGADEKVTFKVGPSSKALRQLDLITTLDPFAKTQKLSVLSTNHSTLRVKVFAADPAQFMDYQRYAANRFDRNAKRPNWKQLSDRRIDVKGDEDRTVETLIDLGPELRQKPGQVIVEVEPDPMPKLDSPEYYENQPILTWVQSTTMALDTFTNADQTRVWATDLRTGAPISGLSVVANRGQTATTDRDGLAVLELQAGSIDIVRGVRGNESFVLPVNATQQATPDAAAWYAFDDRQIYKPGETVSVKGWARDVNGRTGALRVRSGQTVPYTVTDAFGVEIGKGTVTLGPLGGFDLTVPIPMTANLGPAQLSFPGESFAHTFQVAEFRRPEFEVNVTPVTAQPFFSNASVTMSAKASYYAGGALPAAPVEWRVSTSETSFSPAGWDTFTFGIFRPWWWAGDVFDGGPSFTGRSFPGGSNPVVKTYSGTTDANGQHAVQLDFRTQSGKLPDLPVSVNVAGTVNDVNRQAWSDQQDIIVHSANRYVGLRSDRAFVRQGDPMRIDAVVTDVDGKAQPGSRITVTAGLLRSEYVDGALVETVVDPQTCDVTSGTEASPCEFSTPVGGQYRITSTVSGTSGGTNRTELSVWVSGAASQPARTVEQEALTVVPDKQRYAPGETAHLLIQAPFPKGDGLLAIAHLNGVRETQHFTVTDGSAEVEVGIAEADIPSISVTAEVVGASARVGFDGKEVAGAPPRPAYAVGGLTLSVPPLSRTLTVQAKPAASEIKPGGNTSIDVTVTDAAGRPVAGSEFAVVVVDEAVLGLTSYSLPNPIDIFYGQGYSSLATRFGREQVRLVDPLSIVAAAPAVPAPETAAASFETISNTLPGDGVAAADLAAPAPAASARKSAAPVTGVGAQASAPVAVRSNFDALALFKPTVTTDAAGKATVPFAVPDNLTRYRVMVVAVSGDDRFGMAESTLTARLPLTIRPSAPRFLNTGDRFELPVVVQNLDSAPMQVDVLVQVANLTADGPLAKQVTVPANDRVEVRFPVSVKRAGTARYRASGFSVPTSGSAADPASDPVSDSAEGSIPVFTPGTAEAFATYGTIDNGAVRQPVLAPANVFDQYGGLEVSTSSTSLQSLTDALLYLSEYDYQSSDAYASRIMAISALRKVLRDFETADLPSEQALNDAVERDIAGLIGLQNDDGGWSYWRRFERSEPYNSIQAFHAFVIAKQAGYTVNESAMQRAWQYARNVENYMSPDYSESYRDTVRSYSLWVQALFGQRDAAKAAALFRDRGTKLNLDALAWIWSSLDDPGARATVERTITNRAVDTAGAVSFTSGYTDSDYLTLGSDTRTDGIVLDALIENTPKSDLVEKVVAGLMSHRVKGRWDNSQENTFVLLALKRYYDTYESATPDFIARAWLGQQFAGEQAFRGRSTQRNRISIPMKELVSGGNRDLVLQKGGAGRLYYRIGMTYVPQDLTLKPLDRGFVVSRTYEAVDNPSDVRREADGTWTVAAGAKVRVKLTMVAESQRTFVALVDPLPAGFEALNPALANTQPVPTNPGDGSGQPKIAWWWGTWYAHQQFRDDRSEAFTTYLPAGVYEYTYIARATTPGSFVVPPTRAEEMYAPETFGRAATDRVVVAG